MAGRKGQSGGKREGAGRKKISTAIKRDKQWRLSVNEKELKILNKKFDSGAKKKLVDELINQEENMKIISILNQKGGIGKTTSVRNIGQILKEKGKKVLLIDMDQQGNLTTSFGIDKRELEFSIHDLLANSASREFTLNPRDVIIECNGIDLIPSNIHLARADYHFGNVRGREYLLKEILKDLEFDYDYCFIDCPPNLGIITDNALTASTGVYVPIKAEKFALEGISDLLDTIEEIKKFFNPEIAISGVFLNQMKSRTNLHEVLSEEIREYFGDKLLNSYIRDSIKVPEASALNMAITEYSKSCSGAKDFKQLVDEILSREEI